MPRKHFTMCRIALTSLLLCCAQGIAASAEVKLTQDDVDFRKLTYENKNRERLLYRLYVPLGLDKNHKYPLILWLHDSHGRGSDNVKQLTKENQLGTHFWISRPVQANFPVFVMVPQCPVGDNWAEPELNRPGNALTLTMEALAKLQTQFPIDPDRIYVAGQAMGGLGVWSLLQKYPGLWAGAVVISAYDNFSDVKAIAKVPVWVFQGDADSSVPVTMIREMVHELKKADGDVRYTEYHNAGHDIWPQAFADPQLVPWLSSQHRSEPRGSQLGSGAPSSHR